MQVADAKNSSRKIITNVHRSRILDPSFSADTAPCRMPDFHRQKVMGACQPHPGIGMRRNMIGWPCALGERWINSTCFGAWHVSSGGTTTQSVMLLSFWQSLNCKPTLS